MLPFLTTPASEIANLVLVKSVNILVLTDEWKVSPLALNTTKVPNILQLP